MSEGFVLAEMAGEVVAAELDSWLNRLFAIGEVEQPEPPDRFLADEYRLIVNWRGGVGGIEARALGVVNEDFALRKAREIRREHGTGVAVERRKVLRGRWAQVEQLGGGVDPALSQD